MNAPNRDFSRRYRAALLDYLLEGSEPGLARAYDLGRRAMTTGLDLLRVLRTHHRAVTSVVNTPGGPKANTISLTRSQDFLMEALSVYDMAARGYLALIERPSPDHPRRTRRASSG